MRLKTQEKTLPLFLFIALCATLPCAGFAEENIPNDEAGVQVVTSGVDIDENAANVLLTPITVEMPRQTTETGSKAPWTMAPGEFPSPVAPDRRAEAMATGKGDGIAADGYLVETVKQVGPWGELPLQDTPYTMVVASQDFIKNQNIASTQQLFRKIPNVYQASQDGRPGFEARGFGSTVMLDGVRLQFASVVGMPGGPADSHISLFEMERVEVQPGLTGFLTGGGHVGGSVNYATKRPTAAHFVNVTEGNLGRGQWYTHIDTGGPLAGGKVGFRLNLAEINGEGAVKGTNREEYMASLALDWRVSERVLLQVNGGAYKRLHHGSKGSFGSFSGTRPDHMIDPPDPRRSYGQEWEYSKTESYKWGANLYADLTDSLHFRTALLWQQNRRRYLSTTASFSGALPTDIDPGDYGAWIWDPVYAESASGMARDLGGYAYLDYETRIFGFGHKFTIGINSTVMKAYVPSQNLIYGLNESGGRELGGNSVANPQIPRPSQWGGWVGGPVYRVHRNEYTNYVIGDEIRIGEHIIGLVGLNRTYVHTASYLPTGRRRAQYACYETTPNYSLIVKPVESVSVYGTYIESLEDGGMVPERESGANRPFTNAYEVLPPTVGKQYEVGVKADLDGLLVAANYYWIEKANIYDSENPDGSLTRSQDGLQKHHGFEISAIGRIWDRLTLFGGLTYIDATVAKAATSGQRGARPTGVPRFLAKVYAEYELPCAEGLFLTGGVVYMGKRRVVTSTVDRRAIGSHSVWDVGIRYERTIRGVETVARLNVENVGNKHYWASTSYILGDPRTVTFSLSVQF